MMSFIDRIRSKRQLLRRIIDIIHGTGERFDQLKINQGLILAELNRGKQSASLEDYEFGVFSQWGEDGIIQYLTASIDIPQKTFIEFGVEDFFESNCRFLLMKDNWRGFVIDGSAEHIKRLKTSYFYWKFDLVAIEAFVTRENINNLLGKSGFGEDLGILSIDIDGNDYHVLEAITGFRPRILICEYNAVFGPQSRISIPYDATFVRTRKHHSHLYYGASLGALVYLTKKRGYSFVGTTTAGNNAFFVRDDLLNESIRPIDTERGFNESMFRESRDREGNLTFLSGAARLESLKGLAVINVETGQAETL